MTDQASSGLLPVGYRLGEYEIERVLGQGGFGVVYLARDQTLDQPRAIKEFLPGLVVERDGNGTQVRVRSGPTAYRATYEQGLQQFLKEAKRLAALDHPNIVRVYRVLEANGTAYLVMPYYSG